MLTSTVGQYRGPEPLHIRLQRIMRPWCARRRASPFSCKIFTIRGLAIGSFLSTLRCSSAPLELETEISLRWADERCSRIQIAIISRSIEVQLRGKRRPSCVLRGTCRDVSEIADRTAPILPYLFNQSLLAGSSRDCKLSGGIKDTIDDMAWFNEASPRC